MVATLWCIAAHNDENQEDHGDDDDDDSVEDDGYPEAIVATAWCISAQSESFYRRRPSYLECNFQSYEKKHVDLRWQRDKIDLHSF